MSRTRSLSTWLSSPEACLPGTTGRRCACSHLPGGPTPTGSFSQTNAHPCALRCIASAAVPDPFSKDNIDIATRDAEAAIVIARAIHDPVLRWWAQSRSTKR